MKNKQYNLNLARYYFDWRKAFEEYQNLKNDRTYKTCYERLKLLIKLNHLDPDFLDFHNQIKIDVSIIQKRWGLKFPLSPNLRVSKRDLYSTNKRIKKDVLVVLHSFGFASDVSIENVLTSDERFILSFFTRKKRRQGKEISRAKFYHEKKILKFFIYTLSKSKQLRFTKRGLSRLFGYDKNTIDRWIKEVERWPESEKGIVSSEMRTGKRRPDKDIFEHDLPVPFEDDEYEDKESDD